MASQASSSWVDSRPRPASSSTLSTRSKPNLPDLPVFVIDRNESQTRALDPKQQQKYVASDKLNALGSPQDAAPRLPSPRLLPPSSSFFFDEFGPDDDGKFGTAYNHFDDWEDERDMSAYKFTESIRMNLDALSSADVYAQPDGYRDPNIPYASKAAELGQTGLAMDDVYSHLISQLSLARDTAAPRSEHTSSSRNGSPPAFSLRSGRSSSEGNEDELRTPPEPSYGAFDVPPQSHSQSSHEVSEAYRSPSLAQTSSPAPVSRPSVPVPGSPEQPRPAGPESYQLQHQQQYQQPPFSNSVRADHYNSMSPHDTGNDMELLSEDFGAQRRAAGKGKMPMPSNASSSDLNHGQSRRGSAWSVAGSTTSSDKPFSRLGPNDIGFRAADLPERRLTPAECVDIITQRFPALCDAPLREFGEDGEPLPPTKKQETSAEEREARKAAMKVAFCGKQKLSLIKAMVVMENRSASWKRIGPTRAGLQSASGTFASSVQQHSDGSPRSSFAATAPPTASELSRLPEMPSAWSMAIRHEDLDAASIKGKSKKTVELPAMRTNALCPKCEGDGLFSCVTCKGEQADECFWCSGTGREKTRAKASCRRCQGAGVLKCNTCEGKLQSACRACDGSGCGEYGFFVDVKVKRIEMPAAPVASLIPSSHPHIDEVQAAARLALWDSILKLTEAGVAKSKPMVPVMAACVWETSVSHVVSVDVPLAAKFKRGGSPTLRPEGLHRRIPTVTRYFTIPCDGDVRPVEVSAAEVEKMKRERQLPSDVAASNPSLVPSPRSEAVVPSSREFIPRPSPLSQLVSSPASTPRFNTPQPPSQPGSRSNYVDTQSYISSAAEHRRPSAGHILTKKLSSNLLNKLHRGSV